MTLHLNRNCRGITGRVIARFPEDGTIPRGAGHHRCAPATHRQDDPFLVHQRGTGIPGSGSLAIKPAGQIDRPQSSSIPDVQAAGLPIAVGIIDLPRLASRCGIRTRIISACFPRQIGARPPKQPARMEVQAHHILPRPGLHLRIDPLFRDEHSGKALAETCAPKKGRLAVPSRRSRIRSNQQRAPFRTTEPAAYPHCFPGPPPPEKRTTSRRQTSCDCVTRRVRQCKPGGRKLVSASHFLACF